MCGIRDIPLGRNATAVFLSSLLLGLGCAPVRHSPIMEERAEQTQSHYSYVGLEVGVSPYIDSEKARETFGADLFSRGVIPILVIIENGTPSTFLLRQEFFSLCPSVPPRTATSGGTMLPSTTDTADEEGRGSSAGVVSASGTVLGAAGVANFTVTVLQAGGATDVVGAIASLHIPVGAIALAAMIPLAIGGEFASRDIQVADFMTAQAITDRTLYPGESVRGFLYFLREDLDEKFTGQELMLRITLEDIRRNAAWQADVPLKGLFPQETK